MTLSKLNLKPISLAILTSLTFLLTTSITYAEEAESDLYKMCNRQSILTATRLRSNSTNELTAQDMSMIRLGAINACMETYKKMLNAPDLVQSNSADEKVTKKTQGESKTKEESIFDRLLSTERKKDVNPMQKQHRTGGK